MIVGWADDLRVPGYFTQPLELIQFENKFEVTKSLNKWNDLGECNIRDVMKVRVVYLLSVSKLGSGVVRNVLMLVTSCNSITQSRI